MVWIDTGEPCFCYHVVNCFDDPDVRVNRVVVDVCKADATNALGMAKGFEGVSGYGDDVSFFNGAVRRTISDSRVSIRRITPTRWGTGGTSRRCGAGSSTSTRKRSSLPNGCARSRAISRASTRKRWDFRTVFVTRWRINLEPNPSTAWTFPPSTGC